MSKHISNTIKHLILLISIFVVGILLLVWVQITFKDLISSLDRQTLNLKSKITIGEYIVSDLHTLRTDFYELAIATTNEKARKFIIDKTKDNIKQINQSLRVLNQGGSITKTFRLNLSEKLQLSQMLTYNKEDNETSMEMIDLAPKIIEFEKIMKKLIILLRKQEGYKKQNDLKNIMLVNKKIRNFYKITPAFFMRTTENMNRLIYEGSKELVLLEKELEKQKSYYTRIESFLIFIIFALVFIFGYIIARQINENTKKLEYQRASTRAILDGQPNIVVVSDGTKMLDANTTLVDFFDEYNTFDDFKKKHLCICDFFIEDINDPEFITGRFYNDKKWFEEILDNPHKVYKAAMKAKDGNRKYFTVSARKDTLDNGKFILIIVLNDISKEIEIKEELQALNNNLENMVKEQTKELKELNSSLEEKIEEEVDKNRQKDKQLIQQSRFAALGEMIGNIAHQWRQPLSVISSISSASLLEIDMKISNEKQIKKALNDVLYQVNFLSHTIEDFRSFFKEGKEKIKFDMQETLKNTLSITSAAYNDSFIELHWEEDENKEYYALGFPNELIQVLMNILNNAKDALKDKNLDKKLVKIQIKDDDQNVYILLQDNAGGINKDIIDKVFDPYFTTKHQSQGTGIGLYMSKEIIEKHMQGLLSVKNKKFKNDEISYAGACFKIQLPKI